MNNLTKVNEIIENGNKDEIEFALLCVTEEGLFECVKKLEPLCSDESVIKAYSRARVTYEEKEKLKNEWIPYPRNTLAFTKNSDTWKVSGNHQEITELLEKRTKGKTDEHFYKTRIAIPRLIPTLNSF